MLMDAMSVHALRNGKQDIHADYSIHCDVLKANLRQ